jgi:hypothetical protein
MQRNASSALRQHGQAVQRISEHYGHGAKACARLQGAKARLQDAKARLGAKARRQGAKARL